MGTESSWMQKYKQNCNGICLYTVTVMNKAFLLCTSGPGLDFPSCGTGNGDQLRFQMSFCVQGISSSINLKALRKLGEEQAGQISLWAVSVGKKAFYRNKRVLKSLSEMCKCFSLSLCSHLLDIMWVHPP